MSFAHVPALSEVAFEPSIWRWMLAAARDCGRTRGPGRRERPRERARPGRAAVRHRRAGDGPGDRQHALSRKIALDHRRLEIGWTWIAPAWQRSAVNTEAKLLMLETRVRSARLSAASSSRPTPATSASRAALLGIGATFEGIFRKHVVLRDGSPRDSAWFSIIDDEWPAVRDRLRARLARHATGTTASPIETEPGATTRP